MVSLVTGVIGISVAVLIIVLVRKDRLHVNHGMRWIFIAAGFAILGLSPELFDQFASRLGIAYPPVLALSLGIAVLVIKILLMDIERSHIELRNQRLIQRVAMLEADMKKLRNNDVE